MEYRSLGHTGLSVSRLCFGSLTLGPLQNGLAPAQGGAVLSRALALGINFIDTAQLYKTYDHIREGLRQSGREAVISSKTYAYDAASARAAVEEARHSLDRDVVEIFLLHEQEGEHTLRGHREALEELYACKARGIVRAVGLSTHRVAGVHAAMAWGLDVVHPMYNLAGLGVMDGGVADMREAIRAAHAAGLGVFSMKALGGGHLHRRAAEALSFVLAEPAVDAVAVGMKSEEEVEANVAFLRAGVFAPEEAARLEALDRRVVIEEHCLGCGACVAACPAGALAVREEKAVCDTSKCVLCGYCGGHCREFCIKIV